MYNMVVLGTDRMASPMFPIRELVQSPNNHFNSGQASPRSFDVSP
jgi:hypothetical protein